MFVMMRHGQRGDQVTPPQISSIQYDPPISRAAYRDIRVAAGQLAQIIRGNGITRVDINTSPFLRCIMTAESIHQYLSKALGPSVEMAPLIGIDNMFCEFLRTQWFQNTSPIQTKELILYKKEADLFVRKEHLSMGNRHDKFEYPENYERFSKRCAIAKEQFARDIAPNCCRLVVTHGFVTRELCRDNMLHLRFGMEIPFCAFEVTVGNRVLKSLNQSWAQSKL